MKQTRLRTIIFFLFVVVAFAVAIPRIKLSDNATLRGINVSDITTKTIVPDFEYNISRDFRGGQLINLAVDLGALTRKNAVTELENIRTIINLRLNNAGISGYELDTLIDKDRRDYRVLIKLSRPLSEEQILLITSRGRLSFWTSTALIQTEGTEQQIQTVFEGYERSTITNSDIAYANLIADSRVFLAEQATTELPNNVSLPENFREVKDFGIKIKFRQEALLKLLNALASNPLGSSPVIIALDNQAVALQASGFNYSSQSVDQITSLSVYPLGVEDKKDTQLLAAIIGSPTIDYGTSVRSVDNLNAKLTSSETSTYAISIAIFFVLTQIIWVYVFKRKYGFTIVVLNLIFTIFATFLIKVYGTMFDSKVELSIALINGFIVAFLLLNMFLMKLISNLKEEAEDGITREKLKEFNEKTREEYRNLFLILIALAFVIQNYATAQLGEFANGLGFGLVTALVIIIWALPIITNLILQKKGK